MEDLKLREMDLTGDWQSSVLMWKGWPPLRGGKLVVGDPPLFLEGNPVMGIAFLLMGLSNVPFMHLMTLGPQVVALLHGPQEHQLFLDFLLSVPSKR